MSTSLEETIPPNLPHRFRPLPLELNCEIFKCLKLQSQRKFIWGLGRGIYGIFRQQIHTKSKRLGNPKKNRWDSSKTRSIKISKDGLKASNTETYHYLFAEKGFNTSGQYFRNEADQYPGSTIVQYFEVIKSATRDWFVIGLSSGDPDYPWFCDPNLYTFETCEDGYSLRGKSYRFKWNNERSIKPWKGNGDTVGCGILLNPNNKVFIFFTANGILLGKPFPIDPSVIDTYKVKPFPIDPSVKFLFPTVRMCFKMSLEANFGDNLKTKPFKFDIIDNCL